MIEALPRAGREERRGRLRIPELVRRSAAEIAASEHEFPRTAVAHSPAITPRERRLYLALGIVLGLNLLVVFGAVTFFLLLFSK